MEALIENGCAKVAAGTWLVGRAQPVAAASSCSVTGLRGLIVPDRVAVRRLEASGEAWCAAQDRPFLTRLDALPDASLMLASAKLLIAPFESRKGARSVKLIPMSFRRAIPVTEFRSGWAVAATGSRVTRVALAAEDSLTVRPEALVAWVGRDPTGFCPKLGLMDIILPRGPKNLAFSFHGPCTVWFEGGCEPEKARMRPR